MRPFTMLGTFSARPLLPGENLRTRAMEAADQLQACLCADEALELVKAFTRTGTELPNAIIEVLSPRIIEGPLHYPDICIVRD